MDDLATTIADAMLRSGALGRVARPVHLTWRWRPAWREPLSNPWPRVSTLASSSIAFAVLADLLRIEDDAASREA
jgi:hypothetical protein